MNQSPATFWTWFAGFAKRIPNGDPPEELLDELPKDPSTAGYFQLPKLARYIEWHKLKYAHG